MIGTRLRLMGQLTAY